MLSYMHLLECFLITFLTASLIMIVTKIFSITLKLKPNPHFAQTAFFKAPIHPYLILTKDKVV